MLLRRMLYVKWRRVWALFFFVWVTTFSLYVITNNFIFVVHYYYIKLYTRQCIGQSKSCCFFFKYISYRQSMFYHSLLYKYVYMHLYVCDCVWCSKLWFFSSHRCFCCFYLFINSWKFYYFLLLLLRMLYVYLFIQCVQILLLFLI